MKVVKSNAKNFAISVTLLSSAFLSCNAYSKEIGESYIYDRSAVKSLIQPSTSQAEKAKATAKLEEIIRYYRQQDNFLAHKLLFSIYSESNTDLYSLRLAQEQLEKMGTVSQGSYSKYVIDYYTDKKSPFYNPQRAMRIASGCAEQGEEKCLVIMFNAALEDKVTEQTITTGMKESFYNLAQNGIKSNNAKFTYARAESTGIVPNKGLKDRMLIEAAEDLHIPSLETVAGLYAEQYYDDPSDTKLFYYTYLLIVAKNDLSYSSMSSLSKASSDVPIDKIEQTMKTANEKLTSKGYKIPKQFEQP